jgi:3-methyladenine DNA glycosylase AlkD
LISVISTWIASTFFAISFCFGSSGSWTLVKPIRKGIYLKQALQVAERLIQDENDMVQKGVGWLLKKAGRRFPDETIKFLNKMADKNFSTRSPSCLRKTTFKEKALGREAKSLRRGGEDKK